MNILCFGDSNTWGFDADSQCRFPQDVRWSGILGNYLKGENTISEFGICDMTFGSDDNNYKSCNGMQNIVPAIRANSPLDYVVVSLGINDCKKYLFNTTDKILEDAGRLIFQIQRYSDLNTDKPKVIVCEQCIPAESIVKAYPEEFDTLSISKIYQLNRELRRLCKIIEVPYCRIAENMQLCSDGGHYSAEGHNMFAKNLAQFINSL